MTQGRCKCGGAVPPRPGFNRPLAWILALPIRAYRLVLSPWVGMHCRFRPTCSEYALEALARHGAWRGGWLTLRRLARCRPGADWGYDPVPPPRDAPR
ncbi:MAG: membrane protein insertion efficiency factor YidD [Paracoccaceae bacterium]